MLNGHVGNLSEQQANRRFTEWKQAQDRLAQQAQEQAELDQLAEVNPRAAYDRVQEGKKQLERDKALIAAAFAPFDGVLLERYQSLPDKFKQDFGFTPSNTDPVADRRGFIEAIVKAETAVHLDARLKTATDEAFEAGRAAERAERGKSQPVPEVGAIGNRGPDGGAMAQSEFDQLLQQNGGRLPRPVWQQHKDRILAGQRQGLITHG